ncbi:hypothetical protein [Aphanothece sacrum]|uniref:AraC family transcriptional regulator n=1 Tax=Aphanothece sacrum FPU1 TaxID=1920663 RepID=A0A401IIZ8_APHSA|nr:hypothetical protein [Aphanothece sacrum]GBF81273.1 AraC family transcriptional regulator [Aphanothece sacrum FPU1]GBF83377.1 AraC family transcriptional regulator [Aphanothece sacrum FPU3]
MSQSPHDNRKLVDFLKKYRPLPPPISPKLETQLFATLPRKSQTRPSLSRLWPWLIPGALVLGMTAIGSQSRWQEPSLQLGTGNDSEELEAFMVSNWQGTIGEGYAEVSTPPVYGQWMLLENSATPSEVSHP